jgi:hypothetical protein
VGAQAGISGKPDFWARMGREIPACDLLFVLDFSGFFGLSQIPGTNTHRRGKTYALLLAANG